jgi:hypothetical protein
MTDALELASQLAVVVDLAVLDDMKRSVLVRDRLVAGLEVNDRQATGCKRGAVLDERPVAVGASVDERGAHGGQPRRVDRAVGGDDPADPAHGPESRGRV